MSNPLPHRFREAQFRRYEDVIRKAVEKYPGRLDVSPHPLASTTYTARLRDAMRSLAENQWETTVDYTRFMEIYKDLQVSDRGTVVSLGSAESFATLRSAGEVVQTASSTLTIQSPSELEVRALAILVHGRHLPTPILVRGFAHPTLIRELEASLDVAFELRPDQSYLLI